MLAEFLHNISKRLLPFAKDSVFNHRELEWVSNIEDKHNIRQDIQKVIKGLKL